MTQNCLLSPVYKTIGWCMILPSLAGAIYCLMGYDDTMLIKCKVFAILSGFFEPAYWLVFITTDLIDEISVIGLTISLLFISLSREKDKDEYIEKIMSASPF